MKLKEEEQKQENPLKIEKVSEKNLKTRKIFENSWNCEKSENMEILEILKIFGKSKESEKFWKLRKF